MTPATLCCVICGLLSSLCSIALVLSVLLPTPRCFTTVSISSWTNPSFFFSRMCYSKVCSRIQCLLCLPCCCGSFSNTEATQRFLQVSVSNKQPRTPASVSENRPLNRVLSGPVPPGRGSVPACHPPLTPTPTSWPRQLMARRQILCCEPRLGFLGVIFFLFLLIFIDFRRNGKGEGGREKHH